MSPDIVAVAVVEDLKMLDHVVDLTTLTMSVADAVSLVRMMTATIKNITAVTANNSCTRMEEKIVFQLAHLTPIVAIV